MKPSQTSTDPANAEASAGRAPAVSPQTRRRNRLILIALFLVCLAPVLASYLTYYVFKPGGRTNYGDLVQPQQDVKALPVTVARLGELEPEEVPVQTVEGEASTLGAFAGRWLLVVPEAGGCAAACQQRLVDSRQVRLTTGRERSRVGLVLLLSADAAEPGAWLAEHPRLHVLRLDGDLPGGRFPPASAQTTADHVFIVDPLGHVMMRWPVAADPNRMKKDLMRLLKASRIG